MIYNIEQLKIKYESKYKVDLPIISILFRLIRIEDGLDTFCRIRNHELNYLMWGVFYKGF